jgi:hypothetical protein
MTGDADIDQAIIHFICVVVGSFLGTYIALR